MLGERDNHYTMESCSKLRTANLTEPFVKVDYCVQYFLPHGLGRKISTLFECFKAFGLKIKVASAGNRTRAARVAGEHSTTEPPMLMFYQQRIDKATKLVTYIFG